MQDFQSTVLIETQFTIYTVFLEIKFHYNSQSVLQKSLVVWWAAVILGLCFLENSNGQLLWKLSR